MPDLGADLYVKICGLTDAAAVEAAVAAGADAVGFVVVPSPRQISPARAAELAAVARAAAEDRQRPVEIVVVFRWPDPAEVASICAEIQPDRVQVYPPDLAAAEALAEAPPAPGVAWLPAFRAAALTAGALPAQGLMLVDGPKEGSGEICDWGAFAAANTAPRQIILAGGLRPDQVAAAVARTAPYGVDVSSGVESAPGQKDIEKIRLFIAEARAAQF